MKTGFTKGLKPLFIKKMALLMSICYLMNPLQQQINTVLHELSHGLELPNYVMTHEIDSKDAFETHVDDSHYDNAFTHKHTLVDFINTIFQASNDNNNSNDSQHTEITWDKHITSNRLELPPKFELLIAKNFSAPKQLLQEGQFKKLGRPPQNFMG